MLRCYRGMGGFRIGGTASGHQLGAPPNPKGDKIIGRQTGLLRSAVKDRATDGR